MPEEPENVSMPPETPEGTAVPQAGSKRERVIQPLDTSLQPAEIGVTPATAEASSAPAASTTPAAPVSEAPSGQTAAPTADAPAPERPGTAVAAWSSPDRAGPVSPENPPADKPQYEEISLPWLKIAAAGALTTVVAVLVTGLVGKGYWHFVGLRGIVLYPRIMTAVWDLLTLAILMGIGSFAAKRMWQWGVVKAAWSVTAAMLLVDTSMMLLHHLMAYSFLNLVYTGYVGTAQTVAHNLVLVVIPLAGAIGFVAGTYLFNVVQRPVFWGRVAILTVIALLPLAGVYLYHSAPVKDLQTAAANGSYPSNQDLSWAVMPTKMPLGVTGADECKRAPATSYQLNCDLPYENYPGYLTADSQAKVATFMKMKNDTADPTQYIHWAHVSEAPADNRFQPYYYHNGTCAFTALEDAMGIAPQYRNTSLKKVVAYPATCTQHTTVGGTTYYATDENSYELYFVKDGTVVVVSFADNATHVDYVQAIYLTDANFPAQLTTFLDGFSKHYTKASAGIAEGLSPAFRTRSFSQMAQQVTDMPARRTAASWVKQNLPLPVKPVSVQAKMAATVADIARSTQAALVF